MQALIHKARVGLIRKRFNTLNELVKVFYTALVEYLYPGTEVAKPIPSHQIYKGTAFQLVDQAVDFVLSKINLSVGIQAKNIQAPVSYEIPNCPRN